MDHINSTLAGSIFDIPSKEANILFISENSCDPMDDTQCRKRTKAILVNFQSFVLEKKYNITCFHNTCIYYITLQHMHL